MADEIEQTLRATSDGGINYTLTLASKPHDLRAVLLAFDNFLKAVSQVRPAREVEVG